MAAIATVGVAVLDRVGRGDEIERVVARFGSDRVLTRLGHMALDASTAGAERVVVRVIGEHLVLGTWAFLGSVTGKAQSVGLCRFDV